MRLGLVSYNIGRNWDIETMIEKLEAARFEAVELRTTHKHGVEPSLNAAERQKVLLRFNRSKVRLLSLGTTCEFQSPDAKVRRDNIEEAGRFIDLAHDLGCWGIKVRPNGFPEGVPERVTLQRIGESLRECGELGERKGVEIWVEVHGQGTRLPPNMRTIMNVCSHPSVGVCWNSNPTDLVNGSVKQSFDLLGPYIKNCHITDLVSGYPYRELFHLLDKSGYDRYTLCEVGQESKEPDRFLQYYRALWSELQRA